MAGTASSRMPSSSSTGRGSTGTTLGHACMGREVVAGAVDGLTLAQPVDVLEEQVVVQTSGGPSCAAHTRRGASRRQVEVIVVVRQEAVAASLWMATAPPRVLFPDPEPPAMPITRAPPMWRLPFSVGVPGFSRSFRSQKTRLKPGLQTRVSQRSASASSSLPSHSNPGSSS